MLLASPITPLENILRDVLDFYHSNVGLSWAWSIVALTISVRIILVPLMVRQIHSMQSLQSHAPQMKEIQKKYKGDRQKMNEELMKFYRENNINPAASCLPMLLQIPVFISLFYVLRHFSQHVHEPISNLGWLHLVPNIAAHATSHWSGYLLLTIYAASQVSSTYFMSATMDKTQRYIMMILPIAFLPVVSHFPAGLVLYWMTTNLWTVGQGLVTRRLVSKAPPPVPERRSSRTPSKRDEGDAGDGAKIDQPAPKPAGTGQPRVVRRKKKARR
jgi:YidC/Oxa1 family membrane protein insertase